MCHLNDAMFCVMTEYIASLVLYKTVVVDATLVSLIELSIPSGAPEDGSDSVILCGSRADAVGACAKADPLQALRHSHRPSSCQLD